MRTSSICRGPNLSFGKNLLMGHQMAFQKGFPSSMQKTRSCHSDPRIVQLERKGTVAVMTLNSPRTLNAMTEPMGKCVSHIAKELAAAEWLRAVVVTGSGQAFSAGGDLQWLLERHADSPQRNAKIMREFYELFLCVRKLPVPIIAAINGPAIGAGLCFALACDVRIAAPKAKLGMTFVGLGLHPGMGGTHFLPSIVGPQVAARMLLTAEVLSSEQALRDGLVASIDEDCVQAALKMANQMASQAPVASRLCVQTLRMKQDRDLEMALVREADSQAQSYATAELAEGVQSLREKRKPVW